MVHTKIEGGNTIMAWSPMSNYGNGISKALLILTTLAKTWFPFLIHFVLENIPHNHATFRFHRFHAKLVKGIMWTIVHYFTLHPWPSISWANAEDERQTLNSHIKIMSATRPLPYGSSKLHHFISQGSFEFIELSSDKQPNRLQITQINMYIPRDALEYMNSKPS